MWYSNNNDALQDPFAAAILAAAARRKGVAMASSATKITNAAIWFYCVASHWFVRESWLCYVLLPTGRLDSSFFRDALQNSKQLFSLRLPQMTKNCIMRECDNIHSWISLSGDLVFSHQQGIYGFKFPKRLLEISSRDLTSSLLQLI
jgi:hypothetical protein